MTDVKPGDYVVVIDAADAMENGQIIRVRDVDGYGRLHLYGFDGPWNPERFKDAPSYVELADRVKTLEGERAEFITEARSILARHEELAEKYRDMIDQRMELLAALRRSFDFLSNHVDGSGWSSTTDHLYSGLIDDALALIAKLEGPQEL